MAYTYNKSAANHWANNTTSSTDDDFTDVGGSSNRDDDVTRTVKESSRWNAFFQNVSYRIIVIKIQKTNQY